MFSKRKKFTGALVATTLVASFALAGCSNNKSNNDASNVANNSNSGKATNSSQNAEAITLNFMVYNNTDMDYFKDLNTAYQKVKPNVTIELEKAPNDMESVLKVRKAAGELPDIFPYKLYMLQDYKDELAPLDDLEAVSNNLFAKQYAIDGKVLAIPQEAATDFVYYKKSIFTELNLTVPKTWDEFIDTALKIKESNKYIPIALGAKDAWPVYPFNEFMPATYSGNGEILAEMATQDDPFSKGKPFYDAYAKIKELYDAKVFGEDPLGIGFDQAKVLWGSSKAAMLPAGQWEYADAVNQLKVDPSDIGVFYLPVKDNADDTLNVISQADQFLGTPKSGKNVEEAKAFINWFFTSDYYQGYINNAGTLSSVDGIEVDSAQVKEANENAGVTKAVLYNAGGNVAFKKISDIVKFDVKKMGQDMLAGKDLDQMMTSLNKAWKDARAKAK